MATETQQRESRPVTRRAVPMWGKVLVVVSVLTMTVGLALPLFVGGSRQDAAAVPSSALGLAETPTTTTAGAGGEGSGLSAWSPAIFRMGFSFFVGFAVAFALRSFFGFAIAAAGFFFLALFGLQYSGLVEIKWGLLETKYDTITKAASTEARDAASAFLKYMPSATAAAAGFVGGWWRRKW